MSAPALDFVVFHVADLEKSLSYFHGKLGFARVPEQDAPGFYYLRGTSGPNFGLSQVRAGSPAAGAVEVYFKAADLAGLRAALVARQVEATPIVQMPFGAIFSLSSPDGQPLTMLAS